MCNLSPSVALTDLPKLGVPRATQPVHMLKCICELFLEDSAGDLQAAEALSPLWLGCHQENL